MNCLVEGAFILHNETCAPCAGLLDGGDGRIALLGCAIGLEDLLDLEPEDRRDPEGEGEARVVLFLFNGDDRLARDSQPRGELGLSKASRGSERGEVVSHQRLQATETDRVKETYQDIKEA